MREGKIRRRKIDAVTRNKICTWRERQLSAGEIAQLLSEDGIEISVPTVERSLAAEGYQKLPRRTRLKIGLTVQGAEVPETSQNISMSEWDNRKHDCQDAGIFIFAPLIQQLDMPKIVQKAGLPGSKMISALSCFLSFLAVKFFNLNALSSPILVKVHFDVIMTMIADTLYSMLAKKLRGFEDCDASKIYRNFVKDKGKIISKNGNLSVIFPKRAHDPILRAVPWHRMPSVLSWLDGANLELRLLPSLQSLAVASKAHHHITRC